MGLRFRKSVKLAPGIRMNFSGRGASFTCGGKGLSASIGSRGAYLNTGIPGTGLYARERIGGPRKRPSSPAPSSSEMVFATVGIEEDGTLHFRDNDGNPLPENQIAAAKKQQGYVIRDLIQKKCDQINDQIEALGEIHLNTPSPNVSQKYQPREFPAPPPQKPRTRNAGLTGLLFKSKREKIEKENREKEREYKEELELWMSARKHFDEEEEHRKNVIERGVSVDVELMENFLGETLQRIV